MINAAYALSVVKDVALTAGAVVTVVAALVAIVRGIRKWRRIRWDRRLRARSADPGALMDYAYEYRTELKRFIYRQLRRWPTDADTATRTRVNRRAQAEAIADKACGLLKDVAGTPRAPRIGKVRRWLTGQAFDLARELLLLEESDLSQHDAWLEWLRRHNGWNDPTGA